MLGATFWIWYKYVRYFGFPTLQGCRKMLQLETLKVSPSNPREAKDSILHSVVGAFLLSLPFLLLWHWTGFATFLYPAVYLLSVAVKAPIRRARPPAVLLLGGSSYDGTRLQLKLVSIFGSSLVASGLFHKENATVNVSGIFSDLNSIRTLEYEKWQEMITAVLQLSKIVIIDIRKMTDAVQFEIIQATRLLKPEQIFFIGECIDSIPSNRCFAETELLNELELKHKPKKVSRSKRRSAAVYEDKKNRYFRFCPPQGWTCFEYSDPRTKVLFSHPLNPGVNIRFIVKEDLSANFFSLVLHQQKVMQEAQAAMGVTFQWKVAQLAGREMIETRVQSKDSEVILNRLFIADGLYFNISYSAPTLAMFEAFFDEVDRALETVETLHKPAVEDSQKLERVSRQEIAHKIRLAELAADIYDIEKARNIIAVLLSKYPDNKEVQKIAKDLEKISKDNEK
jgi:hypothetical protein